MERMELLDQLQKQNHGTLKCNPGPNCWCAQVSVRLPMTHMSEECMTPKEMLELCDDCSPEDRRYLERLINCTLEME